MLFRAQSGCILGNTKESLFTLGSFPTSVFVKSMLAGAQLSIKADNTEFTITEGKIAKQAKHSIKAPQKRLQYVAFAIFSYNILRSMNKDPSLHTPSSP